MSVEIRHRALVLATPMTETPETAVEIAVLFYEYIQNGTVPKKKPVQRKKKAPEKPAKFSL